MATSKSGFSRRQVTKAGQVLVKKNPSVYEAAWATDLVDKWRAQHAYPMNTFNVTLRRKVKQLKTDVIVAQRLKRLPTIILKLRRFPTMELGKMQDIGGLRAIVPKVRDVKKLTSIYQKTKFEHELVKLDDYIAAPKRSGYRGVHLVYKYRNKLSPGHSGLLLELQFRTRLQHIWATAVETLGTFLGSALKSSQGNKEWLDFFSVTAAAFALIEKTSPVPGFEELSKQEVFERVARAEAALTVTQKLAAFTLAAQTITGKKMATKWYYHVVILDIGKKSVEVKSFARDELRQATKAYSEAEKRATLGERIESVLVSAGPLKSLKRAYPNYFLDTRDFLAELQKIIG